MGIGDNSPQQGYCVYIHLNRINKKVYIGITNNVKMRWARKAESYKRCPRLYSAFKKYGWDNFAHVVLHDKLTKEEACEEEKTWIAFFRLSNCVYNITDGGEGACGIKYSEERRKRISEQLTGRPCSQETRKKISEGNKGKKTKCIYAFNPFTRKLVAKYSSIREAENSTSIQHTNISRAAKGIVATAGGYIWSYYPYITIKDEVLSKVRDTSVYCYDLDGNFIKKYESAAAAARAIKGNPCQIGQCCLKHIPQHKGYIWRRKEDIVNVNIL